MPATQTLELAALADDRRGADARHVSIFRIGKLSRADGGEELCVLRNISASGAMVEYMGSLRAGDRVRLDLRLDERLPARVAWAEDRRCGLAFDAPVDLPEILASHEGEGLRPRPPRLRIDTPVRLIAEHREVLAQLRDISQTGACLAIDERAVPRVPECRVRLDDLGDYRAILCWRRGGFLGVNFASTLPMWPLNAWVRARR